MKKRAYPLDVVAESVLPPEWTDGARWLSRRLNRKQLTGFRVGRKWMMTDEDIDFLISKHRLTPTADTQKTVEEPVTRTLSFTSNRRAS